MSDGRGFDKNAIITGGDMRSSVHIKNKKKDILILGKCPTDVLDDTTLAVEAEYSINFSKHQKKILLKFTL